MKETDMEKLRAWLKIVAKAKTIEQFRTLAGI